MRTLNIILFASLLALLTACGGTTQDVPANADGFATIENHLKDQFGENAYYTELTITNSPSIGNIITTSVTSDPGSLEMGEWTQAMGEWTQDADLFLEIPDGYQAEDFMFQLGEGVSLKKLGELVETSMKSLSEEKNLENPRLHVASISFPDTGEMSKAEYLVMLQPENGGTTFTYTYSLSGELLGMDY